MTDNILSILTSPAEIAMHIAQRARARRLQANLTQAGLATRAGMSTASVKRFERTGLIAFDALIRIAFALHAENELAFLFAPKAFQTIDDVLKPKQLRRKGSIK
jgi:transcriptional regulator with XRE-family HTH domain